jgi:hypothetical protein
MFKKSPSAGASRPGRIARRVGAVATAVALTGAGVAAATPAYAIDNPDPFSCAWNTTFGADDYFHFKIANFSTGQTSPFCFENSGTEWNLDIENVWGLHSGNNAGIVETSCSTSCIVWSYPKWYDDSNYYGTVIMLTIY